MPEFLLFIQKLLTLIVFFVIFILTSFQSSIKNLIKTPKSFENKVIMITGTGNGLGKILAKRFAQFGSKIVLIDINTEKNVETLNELPKQPGQLIKAYTCDVSNPEELNHLAKIITNDFGKIDVLISNAAVLASHKITEGSDWDIKRVIDINLLSNFSIVREFLKLLDKTQGHIVFINSESGIHGLGLASSYAASKAGLLGLAYSLKDELRKNPETKDIKITSVHPRFFASHSSMKNAIEVKTGWLDIQSVADKIIDGIKYELFAFCVPGDFLLSTLFRQLPVEVYNFLLDKYIGGIRTQTEAVFFF